MVVMTGNHDGSSEVDYTVNPSVGFPEAMGPRDSAVPCNSLMPAWDTAMGGLAVVGLLAALRHRDADRRGPAREDRALGRRVRDRRQPRPDRRGPARGPRAAARRQLPLRRVRRRLPDLRRAPRHGRRADRAASGRRSRRRPGPRSCSRASSRPPVTTSAAKPAATRARDLIRELLTPWFGERTLEEIRAAFAGTGVSWGPYQTFKQLVAEDARCSTSNPMFTEVEHPVGTYLTPASPLEFSLHRPPAGSALAPPRRAHRRDPRRARRFTEFRGTGGRRRARYAVGGRPRARNVPTQSGLHEWPVRSGTSSLRVAVGSQDSSVVSD